VSVTRIWFSVEQAADRAGLHWRTVADACRSGSLHGSQRTAPNGRWRIHVDCLDAWIGGEQCPHQASGASAS